MQKSALVLGAGGFIGAHLVSHLKELGYWVRGVDLKKPEFSDSEADEYCIADLTTEVGMAKAVDRDFSEAYQLAADMGGAGYIFTGENDASLMQNSAMINLLFLRAIEQFTIKKIFYASSACIYPEHNQVDPLDLNTRECSAYPASPDSNYGWEKLFSERLFLAHAKNNAKEVRIARFHNVFGPLGAWNNGREKAPAALCRKVAQASSGDQIEIWGDGLQTRSFLYIDECLEGVRRLMDSSVQQPLNIGSARSITIDQLAEKIIQISEKSLRLKHIEGPQGVRGRYSDNRLIQKSLHWQPKETLEHGLEKTYDWINNLVQQTNS